MEIEYSTQNKAIESKERPGWDTVVKKSCLGVSHYSGNVELSGSFTYCQNNCATEEECDVIIETFTRMIKASIADAMAGKQ